MWILTTADCSSSEENMAIDRPEKLQHSFTSLQRELKASSSFCRVSGTKHFLMVGK